MSMSQMTRTPTATAPQAAARALRELELLVAEREELLHRLESLPQGGGGDQVDLARLASEVERLAAGVTLLLDELEALVPPAGRGRPAA